MSLIKIDSTGADQPADFTDHVAVRDTRSGLIWTVAEHSAANWKAANKHAEGLDLLGWSWRLPTVEELFLLADRSRTSPAIDTVFFPDCKSDWYWTGTPLASAPAVCAWYVGFSYGRSGWNSRDSSGFVRAVRSGQ